MEELTWLRGWAHPTFETQYRMIDQKKNIANPPLQRAVSLSSNLRMGPNESFVHYHERVKRAVLMGGKGTKEGSDLLWYHLIILFTIKGYSDVPLIKLLKKLNSFGVSLKNLSQFLDTMSIPLDNGRNHSNKISQIWSGKRLLKKSWYFTSSWFSGVSTTPHPTAAVKDNNCRRRGGDCDYHFDAVMRSHICSNDYCMLYK